MKEITFTQSDKAEAIAKEYSKRKSRAKTFIWKTLKAEHREVFNIIIDEFNKREGGKLTERGDI